MIILRMPCVANKGSPGIYTLKPYSLNPRPHTLEDPQLPNFARLLPTFLTDVTSGFPKYPVGSTGYIRMKSGLGMQVLRLGFRMWGPGSLYE